MRTAELGVTDTRYAYSVRPAYRRDPHPAPSFARVLTIALAVTIGALLGARLALLVIDAFFVHVH